MVLGMSMAAAAIPSPIVDRMRLWRADAGVLRRRDGSEPMDARKPPARRQFEAGGGGLLYGSGCSGGASYAVSSPAPPSLAESDSR